MIQVPTAHHRDPRAKVVDFRKANSSDTGWRVWVRWWLFKSMGVLLVCWGVCVGHGLADMTVLRHKPAV